MGRVATLRGQWETDALGPLCTLPGACLGLSCVFGIYIQAFAGEAQVWPGNFPGRAHWHLPPSPAMPCHTPSRRRARESGRNESARLPVFRRESGRDGPSFLPTSKTPLRGDHAGGAFCMVRMALTDKIPTQDILLKTNLLHLHTVACIQSLRACSAARYVPIL